jgi:hypothetical protein
MATLLPQKSDEIQPLTKCDETWAQLAADKSVDAIPQGSKFGQAPATSRDTYSAQQDQSKLIQSSGGAMQDGPAQVLVKTNDKFGEFINSKWRPMMAFIYMTTCFCDFVLFPILWSILQALHGGQVTSQWMPLTLQGAGLYHIAMGAVLGVAAYGRSQEKIASKA